MPIDLTMLATLQTQASAANDELASLTAQVATLGAETAQEQALNVYDTVLSNVENMAGWLQPGNVGDAGGASVKPNGVFLMTPGRSGVPPLTLPAIFSAKGAYANNNGYFYKQLGSQSGATRFRLAHQFMLPTAADLARCQAIEFELQQDTGAVVFNMAWQADIVGSKVWRYFNYQAKQWHGTSIPVAISPGVWTSVIAEFVRTSTTMTHVGITINGTWYPIMTTQPGSAGSGNYLNCAFQLDTLGTTPPLPYVCKVQNYSVSWA